MPRQSLVFAVSVLLCLVVVPAWAEPPLREIVHKTPVKAVAWSPDGKLLATGSQDGVIRLTESATGKERLTLNNQGPVQSLVFSHDGSRLGVKTTDGALSMFDTAKGQRTGTLNLVGFQAGHLAFSLDGSRLTAAGVGQHLIWNHTMGGASGSRQGNLPADAFATVSLEGSITAWGRANGNLHCYIVDTQSYRNLQVGPAVALAFGPKAQLLAVAAKDKSIRLWEFGAGREVRRLEGLKEPGKLLVFSGNGKTLAAATGSLQDPVVRIWDVNTGRLRRQVTGIKGIVAALALAPDGRTLAVATDDTKAVLWNVALREVARPTPPLALSVKELQALWGNLASADYTEADEAFRRLAATGNLGVPFLKQQVRRVAVPPVDYQRIDKLLADLDSPRFPVRDRANAELTKYGELAENGLRKLLAANPPLEVRRRAEKLLEGVVNPPLTPERVRALEAVELLESLGTAEARQVLEEIGREALLPQIRLEAVAALGRLKTPGKKG